MRGAGGVGGWEGVWSGVGVLRLIQSALSVKDGCVTEFSVGACMMGM